MTEELSLRERKKIKTRKALVEAAVRLFLECGYNETTVDDIVEAVDVSRRTFFRYFSSKEDVLFFDHEEYVQHFRSTLAERAIGEPILTTVRKAALKIAQTLEDKRDEVINRLQIFLDEPSLLARDLQYSQVWLTDIALAVSEDANIELTDLRAWVIAGALHGAVRSALRVWALGGGVADFRALMNEAFDLLERGLDLRSTRAEDVS